MIPSLEEMSAYVIAYVGSMGHGYVGRFVSDRSDTLVTYVENAFVLASGYVITPQGVARPYMLFPVEMLVAVVSMPVHHHSRLFLHDLDEHDFKQVATDLRNAMMQAEAMRQSVRQARSGVVLAPAGTKLPPMGKRG